MKKVITLLLMVSAVASANAQTSQEDSRRVVLGTGGSGSRTERTSSGSNPVDVILGRGDRRVEDNSGTRYPSGTYGSREQQIDRINREYDAKIYSIRNNRTLSAAEKERMIRQLEADRARRIREINNRYYGNDRRRYDDDDDYRGSKANKSNNGNHYGWEKGVGNPHKSGNSSSKGNGNSKGKGKH